MDALKGGILIPPLNWELLPFLEWWVSLRLTDNPANCRWQSGFFLSRTGGHNIYYLCPLQPLRNDGLCSCASGHGSGIRRRIPLCLCGGLLGPLKWQRHSSRGWGLPPALCLAARPPARLPACLPACLACFFPAQWPLIPPRSDTVSQGRVSRYTLLPPTIILPL